MHTHTYIDEIILKNNKKWIIITRSSNIYIVIVKLYRYNTEKDWPITGHTHLPVSVDTPRRKTSKYLKKLTYGYKSRKGFETKNDLTSVSCNMTPPPPGGSHTKSCYCECSKHRQKRSPAPMTYKAQNRRQSSTRSFKCLRFRNNNNNNNNNKS